MFTLRRFGGVLMVAGVLASGAALATGEGGGHPPAGHDAAAAHEGGGHGGGEHAAGEHHADYTGDADHDGTANWLDGDSPDFMVAKLAFHAGNLAILLGALIVFAGPGIQDSFRARALLVRQDLDEAAKLKADAAAHHEAVAQRLAALSQEIADLQSRARAEAEAEERKIGERAAEAAARVAETAQRQIRDEASRARNEIRREAVELAVQLAENILKSQVGAADQRRLAVEFLETVQREGVSHG